MQRLSKLLTLGLLTLVNTSAAADVAGGGHVGQLSMRNATFACVEEELHARHAGVIDAHGLNYDKLAALHLAGAVPKNAVQCVVSGRYVKLTAAGNMLQLLDCVQDTSGRGSKFVAPMTQLTFCYHTTSLQLALHLTIPSLRLLFSNFPVGVTDIRY
jgi:hypothetical protein